jgi:hypothetical protein
MNEIRVCKARATGKACDEVETGRLDEERNAARGVHLANPKGAGSVAPGSALGLLA